MSISLRSRLGTMLFDRPRLAWVLLFPRLARLLGSSWVDFHNRAESLTYTADGPGAVSSAEWSSDLTVGRVFPGVANRLLEAALADWSIRLAEKLPPPPAHGPLVSFIIGHRGLERLPHLLATLRSILGQREIRLECLVVEQAWESQLPGRLPEGEGVRHLHLRPPVADLPYSRSWAFNVGARAARGDILVFHDNDLLVPDSYGQQIVSLMARGYQAARLQRFVFYLSATDTEAFFTAGRLPQSAAPEYCRQNCQGGTLAVERQTYFGIGGHDETFLGWGSEDNEMFDRLRTVRLYDYGYLPFVHLYHGPQPDKGAVHSNSAYFKARMRIAAGDRVAELSRRQFGEMGGPNLVSAQAVAGHPADQAGVDAAVR